MTREEAIKVLNMVEAHGLADEAKRMAIKALEHPEQNVIAVVPCGDCISRQEALKLFATNDGKYLYEAIRDLPSVTPIPCSDAISRQAVEDAMYDATRSMDLNYGQIMEYIDKLPPVNPQEPKTGHWIGHREHCENLGVIPSGLGAYKWCSNCDCGIDVKEWHRTNYNYCPSCGAKMFEPQESEG